MRITSAFRCLLAGLVLFSTQSGASPVYCGNNPCSESCVNLNDIFLSYGGGMFAISSAWSMGGSVSNQLAFEGYNIVQSNSLTLSNTICGWAKVASVTRIGVHRGTVYYQAEKNATGTEPDQPTLNEIIRVMDSIYPTSDIVTTVLFSLIYGVPILAAVLVLTAKLVKWITKLFIWAFGIVYKFCFAPIINGFDYANRQRKNWSSKRRDSDTTAVDNEKGTATTATTEKGASTDTKGSADANTSTTKRWIPSSYFAKSNRPMSLTESEKDLIAEHRKKNGTGASKDKKGEKTKEKAKGEGKGETPMVVVLGNDTSSAFSTALSIESNPPSYDTNDCSGYDVDCGGGDCGGGD